MDFESIMNELRQGRFRPIYFLHGPESFFIDQITDYIATHALTEGEKAFNQTVFYGKDVDHLALVDTARRYPMMASRQVVILKEAQDMKTLSELKSYVQQPMPSTVLVICHKHRKLALNTSFGKTLSKNALVFESKALYDNKIPAWVVDYIAAKGFEIGRQEAELIAEYLGKDLSKIANELDKLAINLPKGATVTTKEIEENIGISKDYNVFELQKAIGKRDLEKVNRILFYFSANPRRNSTLAVIGSLFNYFSKIYALHFLKNKSEQEILSTLNLRYSFILREYKVAARNFNLRQTERAFHILKELDLKFKGVGYNTVGKPEGELLKEIIWKILH